MKWTIKTFVSINTADVKVSKTQERDFLLTSHTYKNRTFFLVFERKQHLWRKLKGKVLRAKESWRKNATIKS